MATDLLQLTKKQTTVLLAHLIALFAIPHLPRSVLILTDNILVRVALLAVLVQSAYINPLTGIASFIVLAFLFIERNRIKLRHFETVMSQSTMDSPAIQSIETPETAPEQPRFDTPIVESHPFMPQDDSGDDTFAPVAESINAKQPLPTEPSQDGSQKAIDQLFGWVNPAPAQSAL
jgi:hypothetical protein